MRRLLILLITVALLPFTFTPHAAADLTDPTADSPPRTKKVVQKHKEWIRAPVRSSDTNAGSSTSTISTNPSR